MTKEEIINFDEEELEAIETFSVDDMPPYPVVKDAPEGWPPLIACDGDSWFEKANIYEAQTGHRVLPLEYKYSYDGETIIRAEDHPSVRSKEDGD